MSMSETVGVMGVGAALMLLCGVVLLMLAVTALVWIPVVLISKFRRLTR